MTEQPTSASRINNDDLLWQQLKTLPAFRALLRAVEARFYQKVDMPEPILDIGCGDGHFAQMAFDQKLQVGIDPWWGPLNKAVNSDMYDLPLQAMGDYLPFPDHCFASAFSNSVLEHIPDIQPVLNEIGRILKPGAPFVITVPSHCFTEYLGGAEFFDRLGLEGMAGSYRNLFNRISRHAHTDPPEVWAERLGQAGFQIERWQYYFSREALHALEIGHAQGVPSAILHALTGHWIIGPYESNLKWTEQWVRPFYEEEFPEQGAYIFFLARKASDGPLTTSLPAAEPFSLAELNNENVISLSDPTAAALSAQTAFESGEDSVPEVDSSTRTDLESEPDGVQQEKERQPIPRRRWLYLLSLLITLLVPRIVSASESVPPWVPITIWLAAIATAFYALYKPRGENINQRLSVSRFTFITSIVLFVTALLVRLYELADHPFILNGTEASIGMDVMSVVEGVFNNPFSTGWLTNPTLPLFILAIPLNLIGPSTIALRLLSPFVGALTVVATYLIGQRLYGRSIGLSAAVLLLGSYFHIHFSRLGLTNSWDALIVLLSLGLIAIAWQQEPTQGRSTWLLAGLAVGFSAYLYTSSHLLPIMLLALLVLTFIFDLKKWRNQWRNVVVMIALALVTALPLLLNYWANPGIFMERANTLGILENQSGWLSREAAQTGASQMQIFGQQLWASALAFNATVDTGTSFGPLKPLLNFAAGIFTAIGFVLALIRLHKIKFSILIIWLVVTIIFAGALLVTPPNSHRFIIAAPAVSLLAALGLFELITAVFRRSQDEPSEPEGSESWYQHPAFLLILTLVIAVGLAAYDIGYYFGTYRHEHKFADRNTEIADGVAHYLNELDGDWSAYFYGPPSMYVDFPTIPFLAVDYQKDRNLFDIVEPNADLPLRASDNHVFIYLPERYDEIAVAKLDYPSGQERHFDGYYSQPLFYVYEVRE